MIHGSANISLSPAECSNLPGHRWDPNLEVSCEDQLFCPPRMALGKPDVAKPLADIPVYCLVNRGFL